MEGFGSFLKEKRQEKNLTQKELAYLLYVSPSAVSKWEKDVAHPDITLLPKLAEILSVTEHELITASIDKKTREEKSQAKKWRALSFSWSLFFYVAYAITILTCFICNLATSGTLSWFWIVLSSLMVAFTFTNLPKYIKKYKLLFVPLSMYLSLCILLATCAIYVRGDWVWIPILAILLGYAIIFAPIYISKYKAFEKIKRFNGFISVGIDFVLLNVMLVVINVYSVVNNYTTNQFWYFKIALPIVAVYYLALNLIMSVKFLKINNFFKTSIVLFLSTLFFYLLPLSFNIIGVNYKNELWDMNPFKANFSVWKGDLIENNVQCIVFISVMAIAVIFFVVGLLCSLKNKKTKSL